MKKLMAGAALGLVMGGLAVAQGAQAAKEPLPFICNGQPVDINVAGGSRVGMIDGVTYKAVTFTFTDLAGRTVFVKTYGNTGKQLSGGSLTCTQDQPGEGTVTVVAVPA